MAPTPARLAGVSRRHLERSLQVFMHTTQEVFRDANISTEGDLFVINRQPPPPAPALLLPPLPPAQALDQPANTIFSLRPVRAKAGAALVIFLQGRAVEAQLLTADRPWPAELLCAPLARLRTLPCWRAASGRKLVIAYAARDAGPIACCLLGQSTRFADTSNCPVAIATFDAFTARTCAQMASASWRCSRERRLWRSRRTPAWTFWAVRQPTFPNRGVPRNASSYNSACAAAWLEAHSVTRSRPRPGCDRQSTRWSRGTTTLPWRR
jgi:hypothetical protein